uniref:LAGLIDADG/HNH endonuclease n=1 Tax=Ophiocordycipitaceae sp. TaxID=1907519 RepID=A0A7S8CU61_9HYPO|nr:LAGLIDADG/HNH endonuclease [Ophiocordycipitaceae sp.]QUT09499.1 LAGLIDADG/HNH endonuclease [Ophiocordycipitaceae sp.]QUT09527.1 LAGLIDADG/HNH endonuclease [Ophiocordycipitaceae sp.]QUT13257.1 LAGLIDADG/HNH endonuclease [Ophiocordycipitaceae sp.]DAJ12167.1 TPA_asm: LAGLIDADG/HNH endonuclease [Ophiocordycipitaceae sp.]
MILFVKTFTRRGIPKSLISKQYRYNSSTNFVYPWWVTGFVDAEGCFAMSIFKSSTAKIGWTIEPITLHVRDVEFYKKLLFCRYNLELDLDQSLMLLLIILINILYKIFVKYLNKK